jgi:hypothetical protein
MNEISPEVFETFRHLADNDGIAATLERLAETLRESGDYHQLFEALKMRTRFQLGLPILYDQRPLELDAEKQNQLEEGLLKACKDVGTLLVESGKLREGWIYLQPIGDQELNHQLIEAFPVTDDNLDEVIDVSLMQLAAPKIGYALILEKYGTCNAITSFDSSVHSLDANHKRDLAKLLTDHLYGELKRNLIAFLSDQGIDADPEATFQETFLANKKLMRESGPMTDATHLSSTMRIGRFLDDRPSLTRLAEMAEYGCQLAEPFHFPSDPPFEKTYRDHLTFYRALCSEDSESPHVQHAIQFFDQKSRSSAGEEHNPVCDEVFVDLLHRLGMHSKAIEVSLERLTKRAELTGIASPVYQIAHETEHYQMLESHYQTQKDLLGFTVSLLMQKQK